MVSWKMCCRVKGHSSVYCSTTRYCLRFVCRSLSCKATVMSPLKWIKLVLCLKNLPTHSFLPVWCKPNEQGAEKLDFRLLEIISMLIANSCRAAQWCSIYGTVSRKDWTRHATTFFVLWRSFVLYSGHIYTLNIQTLKGAGHEWRHHIAHEEWFQTQPLCKTLLW